MMKVPEPEIPATVNNLKTRILVKTLKLFFKVSNFYLKVKKKKTVPVQDLVCPRISRILKNGSGYIDICL